MTQSFIYPDGLANTSLYLNTWGTVGAATIPACINEGVETPDDTKYIQGDSAHNGNIVYVSGSILNPSINITYAELRIRALNSSGRSTSVVCDANGRFNDTLYDLFNCSGNIPANPIFVSYKFGGVAGIISNPSGFVWSNTEYINIGFSIPFSLQVSALELFVSGTDQGTPVSNSIPLWVAANYSFSGINLYTASANIAQTGINLYSQGLGVAASSINLYTVGPSGANNLLNLYLLGNLNSSGSVNLYVQGPQGATQTLPLYTAGPILHSGTSSLNFYTWSATNPSIFNTLPLYTKSDGINRSVPLYTKGPASAQINSAVNFYTSATVKRLDASINLFCENIGADGSVQLYTQGRGIEEFNPNLPGGGISIGNSVPLYIGGNGVGGSINFYLGNSESSSGINFYTAGVNAINGSINLAIPSVLDNSTNSINFHSHGF